MPRHYWLMKSEPSKYSYAQLVRDGKTVWDGVRNFEARNNLRAMKVGDLALFYHSTEGKAVVWRRADRARGLFPDVTAEEERTGASSMVEPLVSQVKLCPSRSTRSAARRRSSTSSSSSGHASASCP